MTKVKKRKKKSIRRGPAPEPSHPTEVKGKERLLLTGGSADRALAEKRRRPTEDGSSIGGGQRSERVSVCLRERGGVQMLFREPWTELC